MFGTAQFPDFLVYNGDTLSIYTNPLESYFDNHSRPDSLFAEIGSHSTACWRGYIAYWELKNDSLFLTKIEGDSINIDFSYIFKDRKIKEKIFADWVNHSIFNAFGKLLYFENTGYASIYEFEREIKFKNGVLTEIIDYDNSKTKKSKYTDNPALLKKYISENIDYSKISEPYEKAKVYVQIISTDKNGRIDSVNVVRGWDKERDLEATRVVKSIPEWDVLYRHGKQFNITWTVVVTFGANENDNK